jgi:hypothetical protein
VTNKNKKRPGGYREPRPTSARPKGRSEPAPRKGMFESLFAPRVAGSTSMPKISTSLLRGIVTVAASPMIVLTVIVIVVAEWLILVAFGFQGPFAQLVTTIAVPPVGTFADLNLSIAVFGVRTGFIALFGFVFVRGVILAILTAMAIDVLQTGSASRWSFVSSLRVLPVALVVNMVSLGILVLANFIAPLLGQGFGFLILMAALVAGVYLLGFATAIAGTEERSLGDTLGRAVRAGRMPGAGNLTFAGLYVISSITVLAVPKPGSLIGVNPSISAWVVVLVAALGHAIVLATLVFRYLNVAEEVPDPPERKRRGQQRTRTR